MSEISFNHNQPELKGVQYTAGGNKVVKVLGDGKRARVVSAEIKLFGSKEPIPISYVTFQELKQAMDTETKHFELENGDMIAMSAIERVRQITTEEDSRAEKQRKQINEFIQQWNGMPPLLTDSRGNYYIEERQVDESEAQEHRAERDKRLSQDIKEHFGKEYLPDVLTS